MFYSDNDIIFGQCILPLACLNLKGFYCFKCCYVCMIYIINMVAGMYHICVRPYLLLILVIIYSISKVTHLYMMMLSCTVCGLFVTIKCKKGTLAYDR